jgi:hypothetical protein
VDLKLSDSGAPISQLEARSNALENFLARNRLHQPRIQLTTSPLRFFQPQALGVRIGNSKTEDLCPDVRNSACHDYPRLRDAAQ